MNAGIDDPLPDLIEGLKDRLPTERFRAAKALGRLGWLARDALWDLAEALDDENAKVREASAQAIGQIGVDALPTLLFMLKHSDKYVRRQAVWALARLGSVAKNALPDLCEALRDTDPRTATGAAQAIGNMGADAANAIPALAEAMRGTNIVLCRLAAKALSQIGASAIPTLIEHLQHADPFVRGESALALGWIGPSAALAVPYLIALLDEKIKVQKNNRESNSTNSLPSAVTPVTPLLISPSEKAGPEESSRLFAIQALGRMGSAAVAALPTLQNIILHGPEPLRPAAQTAIRLIQGG